jgi:hypothetical protein
MPNKPVAFLRDLGGMLFNTAGIQSSHHHHRKR